MIEAAEMPPRQLIFRLPTKVALGREAFFVAPANANAVAMIEGWQSWPGGKLALAGPAHSGKTHLVHVWAAASGARIIEARDLPGADIPALADGCVAVENVPAIAGHREAERALFHLHNLCLASGGRLMVTGAEPPARWPLALPDLASRLQAALVARIEPPDDALLAAVIFKQFSDRQLVVGDEVVTYLVARINRSFEAARQIVAAVDETALRERRAITVPFARRVLADLATDPD